MIKILSVHLLFIIYSPYDRNARTAIVFMPVKLATVADPPRISIDDTIMLVARLRDNQRPEASRFAPNFHSPEEHEHKMSCGTPSSSHDLKPCMSPRGVQFELRCQLYARKLA